MLVFPGIFLQSTPSMDDPNFEQAIVFITESNEKGAIGFVINKLFSRRLNDLVEFRHAKDFPLHAGGPVDTEHLFILHRRPDIIADGTFVKDEIYIGGNFEQAVRAINNKNLSGHDIKIFVGYCGWNDRELEKEIEEKNWQLIEPKSIFDTDHNHNFQ